MCAACAPDLVITTVVGQTCTPNCPEAAYSGSITTGQFVSIPGYLGSTTTVTNLLTTNFTGATVTPFTGTASVALGSGTTAGLLPGMTVSGVGLTTGTIVSVDSATSFTISTAPGSTLTGESVAISGGVQLSSTPTGTAQGTGSTFTSPGNLGLGASAVASNLILDGGALSYVGTSGVSTDRLFTLTPNGGTIAANQSSGLLAFTNSGAIVFSGAAGPYTLTLSGSGNGSFAPLLANAGNGGVTSLIMAGAGTWSVSGANTYTGGTSLNSGTVMIAASGSLGTGTLNFNGGTLDASAAVTLANLQNWTSGTVNYGATNPMNFSSAEAIPAGGVTITVDNANKVGLTGVLSGAGPLTINAGLGTVSLSASNTFTGNVVINSGTVIDNNNENSTSPTASGLGNPQTVGRTITVNAGAALVLDINGGQGAFGNQNPQNARFTLILNGGFFQVNERSNNDLYNVTLNGVAGVGGWIDTTPAGSPGKQRSGAERYRGEEGQPDSSEGKGDNRRGEQSR